MILAYAFNPETLVGALRPLRFYKYLRRMGYDCTVVSALNDPDADLPGVIQVPDRTGERRAERAPSARLSAAAHVERALRRFVFPGEEGAVWACEAAAAAERLLQTRPPQPTVLFSTYPPLGSHLAAIDARRRLRIPWIADFRDPLGAVNESSAPLSAAGKAASAALARYIFRTADAVITPTERIAAQWREAYPRLAGKLHVIWNGFDPEDPLEALPIPGRTVKLVVHAGSLYWGRNPNIVIRSLERLRERGAPGAGDLRVLLVGDMASDAGIDTALYARATAGGWLEIRDRMARAQVQRTMGEADGLLLIQPQSQNAATAKIYEYIRIGRPVLAIAPRDSVIEWLLRNAGTPYVCVYPDDADEAVDAKLSEYLRLPSAAVKATDWFYQHFDGMRQTQQLAALINALVEKNRVRPTPP